MSSVPWTEFLFFLLYQVTEDASVWRLEMVE
jgi:hypothetical protein